jgi:hypothetical protein
VQGEIKSRTIKHVLKRKSLIGGFSADADSVPPLKFLLVTTALGSVREV